MILTTNTIILKHNIYSDNSQTSYCNLIQILMMVGYGMDSGIIRKFVNKMFNNEQ